MGNRKLLILVIFLVVLLVFKTKANSTQTLSTPTPVVSEQHYNLVDSILDTNLGEKLLTSKLLGISIKYPNYAYFQEREAGYKGKPSDGIYIYVEHGDVNGSVSLDVMDYSAVKVKDVKTLSSQFFTVVKNRKELVVKSLSEVTIGGKKGYVYGYKHNNSDNTQSLNYLYLLPRNEDTYYMIQTYDLKNLNEPNVVSQNIIKSIEFLQ